MMKRLLLAIASLLLATSASAQVGQRTFTANAAPAADSGIGNFGSGIAYHQLTWNDVGLATGCSVKLQQSADDSTWSDLIAAQDCSTNGQSTVVNVVANYIRINVTAFTGSGEVVVHWSGFNASSGGGGTVACSTSGGIGFETAANTLGCDPLLTWDNTGKQLNDGTTSGMDSILTGLVSQNKAGLFANKISGTGANYPIMVLGQSTNNTTTSGVYATTVAKGSADSSDFAIEADAYSLPDLTATQAFNGAVISFAANNGAGTVTDLFSVAGQINNQTGTTTRASNFWSLTPYSGTGFSGTVHNIFGFQSQPMGIFADTLNAAFHAEDQGLNAKSFAFYTEGGQNRFNLGASQVLPILDIKAANAPAGYGSAVIVRGDGLGMIPVEGEGALLEVAQHDSNTVGIVIDTADGPAGNSFDITAISNGSTNLTHSADGATEFDYFSFNADGSEQVHPAAGKALLSPAFAPTLSGHTLIFDAAPTVSSGFGTGAAISANNGPSAFRVSVGTSNTGTGVVGLPTAATGWNCFATNISTKNTNQATVLQTASSTASATFQNYTDVMATHAMTDNDVLSISCFAY